MALLKASDSAVPALLLPDSTHSSAKAPSALGLPSDPLPGEHWGLVVTGGSRNHYPKAMGNPVRWSGGSSTTRAKRYLHRMQGQWGKPCAWRKAGCLLSTWLSGCPLPSFSDLRECPKLAQDGAGPQILSTRKRSQVLCNIPRKHLLHTLQSRSKAGEQPAAPAYPYGDATLRSLKAPSFQKQPIHQTHQQWKWILKMHREKRERCCSLLEDQETWP